MVARVGYLFRTSIGRIEKVTGRARAVREQHTKAMERGEVIGRMGVQQENIRLV